MCRTGKYAAKQAARKAALSTFIQNMPPMKNFTQIARDVLVASCGDGILADTRAYSDKRAKGGRRVKLFIVDGDKVFGPALYNAYTILSKAAPDFNIQIEKGSCDSGEYLSVTFSAKV